MEFGHYNFDASEFGLWLNINWDTATIIVNFRDLIRM
jgi:hypothetical protein